MVNYPRRSRLSRLGIFALTVVAIWIGKSMFWPECGGILIKTPLGCKTYNDIEINVFRPLGYKIRRNTFIPTLDYTQKPVCVKVFADWLAAGSEAQDESVSPPKQIPPELVDQFTLASYTQLVMAPYWMDDRSGIRNDTWSEYRINLLIQQDVTNPLVEIYVGEGRAIYYAMRAHSSAISGKTGAVIGSMLPWVEIYALKLNAKHVTTMEYMKIKMEHPKMSYAHPVQVARDSRKFIGAYDWIATFSSLEHSGLGRYGDAMDPIGDLREAMKMYCMLKKGGYLFFAVPMGYDTIYFNWHRIYGRIRLALMFSGFDLVEMFYRDSKILVEDIVFDGEPEHNQPVAVLRKR